MHFSRKVILTLALAMLAVPVFVVVGAYFSRQNRGILGAGVAVCAQDICLAESGVSELLQEGYTLLCSCDSRKPVVLAVFKIIRQWLPKYHLGGINDAPWFHDSR